MAQGARSMHGGSDAAIVAAHAATVRLDPHEMAHQLVDLLGPTLVSVLAGVKDRKLPSRWAQADGPIPRSETSEKLLAAHRVLAYFRAFEINPSSARNWFIALNPLLDETSPVIALRDGNARSVIEAARQFVAAAEDDETTAEDRS